MSAPALQKVSNHVSRVRHACPTYSPCIKDSTHQALLGAHALIMQDAAILAESTDHLGSNRGGQSCRECRCRSLRTHMK